MRVAFCKDTISFYKITGNIHKYIDYYLNNSSLKILKNFAILRNFEKIIAPNKNGSCFLER